MSATTHYVSTYVSDIFVFYFYFYFYFYFCFCKLNITNRTVGHFVVTSPITKARRQPTHNAGHQAQKPGKSMCFHQTFLAYTSIKPFDVAFHPKEPVVFSSLLTGQVCAWSYDDATGETSSSWSVRPSKRTARALSIEENGDEIWMGGKSGSLLCALTPPKVVCPILLMSNCSQLSTRDGSMTRERDSAHE